MAKKILVTIESRGGVSGVPCTRTEVRTIGSSKSRPMFAMSGSRHCGGLPIQRRTEKFYAGLDRHMMDGGN